MRQQISKTADEYAARWLDQLMQGHLGLHEVPFAFAAWYNAGVAEGRAARQSEIDALNHQLDVLYMQAVTPKERQAEYRRRLEEHHEREADEFFGTTPTGVPTIDPATNAEIEGTHVISARPAAGRKAA